jgi:hypothetical protein
MPLKLLKHLGFGFICLCSTGCFQIAEFFHDHIITSPGMDKAVNVVEYTYQGVFGPDGLWLSNDKGLQAHLRFEMAYFPDRKAWEDLNLDSAEAERLKIKAEETLRDYFTQRQRIQLITLKKVAYDQENHNYLLDAKTKDQMETVVEKMVRLGLYVVDTDLAKSSNRKSILRLQNEAQRSRLGIWRYASVFNPNWHD